MANEDFDFIDGIEKISLKSRRTILLVLVCLAVFAGGYYSGKASEQNTCKFNEKKFENYLVNFNEIIPYGFMNDDMSIKTIRQTYLQYRPMSEAMLSALISDICIEEGDEISEEFKGWMEKNQHMLINQSGGGNLT